MENNLHDVGQAYRKALATPPPSASMSFLTAKRHINAKEYKKAMECLLKTEKLFPEYPKLYRFMGSVYGEMRQPDKAAEAYKKAIKADGEEVELLRNLGTAYLEQGLADKSETALKRAVELDPKDELSWFQLAMLYGIVRHDYPQGIASCRKAYALNPRLPLVEQLLGILLTQNEQPKEALPYLLNVYRHDPNGIILNMWLGLTYSDLDMFDQALKHLQRVSDLLPQDWMSYYQKGIVYKLMGRDKQSIACFQHAFKLEPTNGDLPWEIASASVRVHKLLDFVLYARKAVALGNQNGKPTCALLEMIADFYQRVSQDQGRPLTKEEFKMWLRYSLGEKSTWGETDSENAIIEVVVNADKYEDPTGYVIGTRLKENQQKEMRTMDLPSRIGLFRKKNK